MTRYDIVQKYNSIGVDTSKFREDVEEVFNSGNNPKFSKLFIIAWGYGHSYGCHEVLSHIQDLLPLIEEEK